MSVDQKIISAHNTVSAKKGTESISMLGWVGFNSVIDKFGYCIDGGDEIMTFEPIAAEPAVVNLAGENAKRYRVVADISDLAVGLHTFDLLVRLDTDDGAVMLKLISFTLNIEE